MEILGIGPLELMLIAIVVLLVIKPEDWGKTGRMVAQWINQITSSDAWRAMNESWRAASQFSTELRREVNLEHSLKELDELTRAPYWTNPSRAPDKIASSHPVAGEPATNVILPPHSTPFIPPKSIRPAQAKAIPAQATAKRPAKRKSKPAARKQSKPKKTNA